MDIDIGKIMGLVKEIDPNSKIYYKVKLSSCTSYYLVNGWKGFTVAYHFNEALGIWTSDCDDICDDRFWSIIEQIGQTCEESEFYWASHKLSEQNNF